MNSRLADIGTHVLRGDSLDRADARWLLSLEGQEIYDLLYWANRVRHEFKGNEVKFCAILSAKQGLCPEDCKFCAQSAHHFTGVPSYPLMAVDEIVNAARRCDPKTTLSFGVVTSGPQLATDAEWERVLAAVRQLAAERRIGVCGSLGFLTLERAKQLREAGMQRYNHNLETSASFFPRICTTHTYEDRVATVRVVKQAGMEVCCGGIFGMGETIEDRLDLAFALRELDVDAIPLNFLHPIPGTPFGHLVPLSPMEILKIIAVFRLIHPRRDIKVCGGREHNLRDLQSWMFYAGANGAIIGNYLTTKGRSPEDDVQMVRDLGMTVAR